MFERFLVPLDGSDDAARALGPAALLARTLDSPLRIVSYVTTLVAQGVADSIRRQVADLEVDDISVHIGTAHASVASELLDEAATVPGTTVVLSSRGASRSGALLGSVADGLLARGFGPILLVGPSFDPSTFVPGGSMLIPLDGSELAETVLPIASSWALVLGMKPDIVAVMDQDESRPPPRPELAEALVETNVVARAAKRVGDDIGAQVDYDVLHGPDPAKAIAERAAQQRSAMIAMSTHGRTGLERLIAGSVAMKILHHAPCPVLLSRPPHLR